MCVCVFSINVANLCDTAVRISRGLRSSCGTVYELNSACVCVCVYIITINTSLFLLQL
jgi:hypothetical protein